MVEINNNINLMKKKFERLDEKLEGLGDITDHFHDTTDKLERLYQNDID